MNNIECSICKTSKPLTEFRKREINGKMYYLYTCNRCISAKRRIRTPKIQDLPNERWLPIEGFEKLYLISDKGRVKSLARKVKAINSYSYRETNERILKQCKNVQNHYMYVGLKVNGEEIKKTIHVLMATAFIPNPENKPEVNHKNGIRWDNWLDNFEWATTKENADHKFKVLGYKAPRGENNKMSKGVIIIYPNGSEQYVKGTGEVGRRLGGLGGQMISKVIQGTRNSYKGCKFRYATIEENEVNKKVA